MELELVLVDAAGGRSAVTVTAAPADPAGAVRTALAGLAGLPPTAGPLHVDGRVVADRTPVADAGLLPGAVVALGRPLRDRSGIAAEGLELAVVGGLGAGATAGLRLGRTVSIGRDPRCDLALDDEEVSRGHATVTPVEGTSEARMVDTGSRNGVRRRGYRMAEDGLLAPGDAVGIGETVLELRRPAPAAPIVAGAVVNRPPRIVVPAAAPEVAVPAEPDRPRAFRLPLAGVLAPLALAAILFAVMDGNRIFLVFLALSPVLMLANVVGDRRSGRKDYVAKKKEYDAAVAALDTRLAALAVAEERTERAALPDPAALLRAALAPTARLWERRPADEDFLRLRLGLVDRPLRVQLRGRAAEHPVPTVHLVPLAVDLAAAGVLGVAGPRAALLPAARALLAQLGTLHDPDSLGLVLLTGRDEAADWEWASWLPHTRPAAADQVCTRLVGTDYEQAESRIAELRRIVEERHQERRSTLRDGIPAGRRFVLVLDGARRLRELRGLADLLRDGPAVGVYAVCLDADEASLPDECRATAVAGPRSATRWRVRLPGREPVADVLADGMAAAAADRLGRALAPLRLLGAAGAGGGLPDTVRYLDLLGLAGDTPTAADVRARWSASPGARSTAALLGVGPDGPVTVDLRRDGPHALVAGTSGAGKSELLQTLVTSLALGNAPDALNFVLVDYKGGSAFAACQDLPHCVGMVTDLDGHLVHRALASLSAELRRRESILAEAGAKDIEDYWARTGGRLPRLVIVVDEFASLVEEIPDFVPGVVGIGMRGRSLGVHVVLATQRPGGVVSAEMRANLNLRIGLRVTSTAESSDVVDAPDAARISTRHPGRAYLRTGHRELTAFQAARVGRPRSAAVGAVADEPVRAVPRRVTELGRAPAAPEAVADDTAETDLSVLVGAIRRAAAEVGAETPPSPWLPPLPATVGAAELPPVRTGSPVAVRLGVVDRPDRQAQEAFVVDLERTGPLAVAGAVRSGRSTALRTLAAGLAEAAGPADVHLYAIDCGNRALAGLAALPHCGAVVDGADNARVERLLALLDAEVGRRQRLLGAAGHASLAEHRGAVGADQRLPHVVLLIDRWEAFTSRYADLDAGVLVDRVEGLLRRGPAVGVTVVLSTDRTGFSHRVSSALAARLVLRQADREDAAVFGINPRSLPAAMPAGRAVWAATGEAVQVALLDPTGDSGSAEAAAVERLAAALRRRWDGVAAELLPRRVDPLPDRVTPAETEALRVGGRPAGAGTCTIGVGGDHLGPLDVNLVDAGGTFVVAGPPRSGRSTTLLAVAASLAGRGSGDLPLVVVAPRPSPLRALAGEPGVREVLTGTEVAAELDEVLAEIGGPVCLVVDDGELLADGPAGNRLERFVRQTRDDGSVLVAAATTEDLLLARYRGWLAAARRSRSGLLLDPRSHVDGEVFDLRLPRSTAGGWPAGRGLLVLRGLAVPVQVPAAEISSVPS